MRSEAKSFQFSRVLWKAWLRKYPPFAYPAGIMISPYTNLIPCDEWDVPFVDAYSQFSLGFHQKNFGPAFLHPRGAIATYEIAMPLLQLWLKEGSEWQVVRRQGLVSLPWLQIEEATLWREGQPIKLRAEYVYANARRLVAQVTICNEGDRPVAIEPAWVGCIRDRDQPTRALKPYPGSRKGSRKVVLLNYPHGIEAALEPDPSISDLPHVRYRITTDPKLESMRLPGPIWGGESADSRSHFYQFSLPDELRLVPDSPWRTTFTLDYRGARVDQALDPWDEPDQIDFSSLRGHAEARFRQEAQGEDFSAQPSMSQFHLLRARTSILRTGMRGYNGEFGDHVASLCSAGTQDFSCSFFWDTLFVSVALSRFNPDFARDAFETAFIRHNPEDGSTPERKWNFPCPQYSNVGCPQSPIGAWALNRYLQTNQSKEDYVFADRMYSLLRANHHFWRDHSDADGDGLSEYNWSGQIGDNSPIWDSVATGRDEHSGCCWLPPIASAACNSYLFRDAREMAHLAKVLGITPEVAEWEQRAAFLANRMQEILWVDGDQRYWDYNHRSRHHIKSDTFFMFLPLWAGLPMPDKAKTDLIENHLLAPEKYFGSVPFPSVAYNDPAYESGGYWRGRAWSHFSCWLIELLWHEGYRVEADEAADRVLSWQRVWDFRENMNTDPSALFPRGFPYYNWGSAAYCFLAERQYRDSTRQL